jgi:integrase/recombinase XerD
MDQAISPNETPATDLSSAADRFLNYCRSGRGLSAHTLRAYSCDLDDFAAFAGPSAAVERIDREGIRSYVQFLSEQRKLKETTIRRRAATLRVFFAWLETEQVIQISVFHRLNLTIRLPRRLPRALRGVEMRQLLRASERRANSRRTKPSYSAVLAHFTLVALFTTGLRVGELVSARTTDADSNDGSIQVRGKGNRERRVYMPGAQAVRVLKNFLAVRRPIAGVSDQLLVDRTGRPVTTRDVRVWLRRLAEEVGIARRVTPHMLRHTAATQLLNAGVDIRFVQQLLGHASIATTQIYTHVSNESLRARLTQANTLARVGIAGQSG